MNKLKRILFNKGSSAALMIISLGLAVFPENIFREFKVFEHWSDDANVIFNRIISLLIVFALANFIYWLYYKFRRKVSITGSNYTIEINYGDLLAITDGKVLIHFDECFTTKVGNKPAEVKPNSVCGQYLKKHPIDNIKVLITRAGILPEKDGSRYKNQVRYEPGTIIQRDNYLLMAFAKLDERGIGVLSYEEYLKCLDKMWEQIEQYRGTDDIYIPILGSRLTNFNRDFSQQELLNIMINSYRLTTRKIKIPNKLHIVCKERQGFFLNDIDGID